MESASFLSPQLSEVLHHRRVVPLRHRAEALRRVAARHVVQRRLAPDVEVHPVIDEANYDRFAALVIADLNAGPLHDAAADGEGMLLVGELNPLTMSEEHRRNQKSRTVSAGDLPGEGGRS